MYKMLLLFSHQMTPEQIKDANENLKTTSHVYLPEDLQAAWSNVNPEGELDALQLNKIANWIKENADKGDHILIQGEAGMQYYFVDFCLKSGLVPIYATTKRISEEKTMPDGSIRKINIFKHVQFRAYEGA